MEKRVLLATVVSVLIIIGWTVISRPRRTAPLAPGQGAVETAAEEPVSGGGMQSRLTASSKAPRGTAGRKSRTAECRDYTLENENWKIVFNSLGASVRHWYLKEGDDESKWPDLVLDPDGENMATYPDEVFSMDSRKAGMDGMQSVSFSALVDGNMEVVKTYEISDDCRINNLVIDVTARKNMDIPVELSWGPGLGSDIGSRKEESRMCRVKAMQKGDRKVKKLKPNTYGSADYSWLGIDNRYFTVSFLDISGFRDVYISKSKAQGSFKITLSREIKADAGRTETVEVPFYAGIKQYEKLKELGYDIDRIVSFGIFAPIGRFFLKLLKTFYGWTGNFGVAIIMLTVLIQCFTFPLTLKSFESSKAMRAVQPKMKELQEKFKSDPKRLNTEIMHLYKTHKVNPLGGCLPMLLQLPIFWALFATLRGTYELRGAPFVLWIKDLSSPDLLFSISGIPVRVLPLLMGVSMFLQQKVSGAGTDPSQKTMMYMMPVIFTIIFMNFPSGLVLYWLVNSVLVTGLQFYILKKSDKSKQSPLTA